MTTTAERPTAVAPRLRRPGWRDPRLLVGILLVALSVLAGSWAVSSAGETVPVYAASRVLTAGDSVDVDQLRVEDVRLGADQLDLYVRADGDEVVDTIAIRTVGAGELLPSSALGDAGAVDVRPVALTVTDALSDRVVVGAPVDVWFVPEGDEGGAEPRVLVEGAVVDAVDDGGGAFVVGGATTLHVLVPGDVLDETLAALATDGVVSVVPVGGSR
ncbi:hypothetical protein SAMN04489860_1219 [Paraoerskovia marina]|uniref:Chaperone for flagella basal body P-ring formation n=1 Tax=Paraoerskovia marina TaxID=545619 RepID=A0A1H1QZS7_9CELL|nr:hypothetical protein [Paraoerskovia marina]SDS28900.1 hypothetical protein SAMN04489860_1219 [Paraoerskovia marina]